VLEYTILRIDVLGCRGVRRERDIGARGERERERERESRETGV
jgi:hypothetical protein